MKRMKMSMKSLIMMFVMAMAFVVTGITSQAAAPTVVTDYTKMPDPTIYTVQFAAGETSKSASFTIPGKGIAWIDALANTDVTMDFNGTSVYVWNNEETDKMVHFSQGGTYTLNMTRSAYDAKEAGILYYYVYYFNSGNSTVKANQVTAYASQAYNEYSYTKITVPSTGYIKVDTPAAGGSYVYTTLLNSKKKAVSDELYTSNSVGTSTFFGVSKGTYYIRTRAGFDSLYNVKYTFTKVKEKSGSSKSKAVEIKKGKTVKGVLTANGKSQTDWYKVKLTKKKVFKLTVKSFNTDSSLKIQVIPANKNMRIIGSDTARLYSNTKAYPVKSTGAWSAGTYYIKVTKYSKKDSGYYQIKFNK